MWKLGTYVPEYRAESSEPPKIQAWVFCEDKAEADLDPMIPRRDGWRIVIEYVDQNEAREPIRSTWMETLKEVLEQTDYYFPEEPVWKAVDTGEVVDLGKIAGHRWQKLDPKI